MDSGTYFDELPAIDIEVAKQFKAKETSGQVRFSKKRKMAPVGCTICTQAVGNSGYHDHFLSYKAKMDRKRAAPEKTLGAFKSLKKIQLSENTLRDCLRIACEGYHG